jgi:DNA-binding CsgD family transcriptional regulator
MKIHFLKPIFRILLLFFITPSIIFGQNKVNTHISGRLSLDNTWASTIYLSYIPTFDDLYAMSNEMIIARTELDSTGFFKFDIDFLPPGENLFRLHIIKKGDTPATLIIGGKDENHLFLIVNPLSDIQLICNSIYPPFKNVNYKNSNENSAFQKISDQVFVADSIAAESSALKRALIEKQLQYDLLSVADTSNNLLVSLYAIYKSKFESNYSSNKRFYKSYMKKWRKEDNTYFRAFERQVPVKRDSVVIVIVVFLAVLLAVTGFFLGKHGAKRNKNFEKLSIQERKIYEMLQHGATNQEISDNFNIGMSTVKSHVSSIFSKLNIKSRKEIMDLK